jgi:TolB protein
MRPFSPSPLLGCICWSLLALPGLAPAQNVALQAGEQIAVASLSDGSPKLRRLINGADPCISPDGTKVAYTQSDDEGNRRIAICDPATGKSDLVEGIEGNNEFGPVWSSDGATLVFNHFDESDWSLAAVNASGGNFRIVIGKGVRQAAAFANIPGTSKWLCHDLDGFYLAEIGETGAAKIEALPGAKPVEGLSMPGSISVSPDGKHALFERLVEAETGPDDEGPPSAVFLLDIASGEITRVTPKGLHADHPGWLPGGREFLFGSYDSKTQQESVSRMSIEPGSQPSLVFKQARNPSVAAK